LIHKRHNFPRFTVSYLIFIIFISLPAVSQIRSVEKLGKVSVDDYNNYTTVGQIGLTITNFGLLGEGWNKSDQPSCRYKQYADIAKEEVEHFSYAGLWIGGLVQGTKRVSTAIVDGAFDYAAEGFEFTTSDLNSDTIKIESSIQTSKYFSPKAVSHQDFICDFTDDNSVVNHVPMGIRIHQESYAWNYSFTESFVILDYTIYNESHLIQSGGWSIEDIYCGIWMDASVGNMNYTSIYEPGGGFTWYDNLDGFDKTIFDPYPDDEFPGNPRNIAYQYDEDGDNGYAQSYIGVRFLGNTTVPLGFWDTYYRQWVWTTSSNADYPEYVLPIDDAQRYDFMHTSVPKKIGTVGFTSDGYPSEPDSWLFLLSAGPFGSAPSYDETSATYDSTKWVLEPGDSVRVAFAIVCARWANNSITDNATRRYFLHANSDWAQTAFNGEDINGNGVLDPDEDVNMNGILDRYILPAPPPSPEIKVYAESDRVTIYWNNKPEYAKDPLTQKRDFEGYRIYSRKKTYNEESTGGWSLLAQFDMDDNIGYDTGFDLIRIDRNEACNAEIVGSDTIKTYNFIIENNDTLYFKIIDSDTMFYRFVNTGIKAGWPDKNVYSVTSYDQGDEATGLESLESNIINQLAYVVAGQTPQTENFTRKIGVYPNPYKGRAIWDGYSERERMIWFYNLPARARIKIFTLSGELVDEFDHNSDSYNGSDIQLLQDISSQAGESSENIQFVLSGGEHAWDMITKYDQAIATGLYIFTVEDLNTKDVQTGKFLVIK